VTLLWLLAQSPLGVEGETKRRLFWTRKVAVCVQQADPSMPPRANSLMQAVRGAQPNGGTVADAVVQARRFYGLRLRTSTLAFFPVLVGRGLLEEGGSCERRGAEPRWADPAKTAPG
jgi:hypothetical protein